MISVLVYGRNDAHGYNLHKRTAIFFNTLGRQLTDPGDEIVFVDCNTHDALPTFPEALQDLLTPEARALVRVLRIRPATFRKALPNSRLPVTEVLSRNVGLRRTSPGNRFVLSTNSDMVFVAKRGRTLSQVAADAPEHHHFLPRFDVPEWLWEGLDRLDPQSVEKTLADWSTRFHLNEICRHKEDIAFDSPGDFQLMPRSWLFDIHGFDERMNLGWHVDANIARRLYLKYGPPRDFAEDFEGFHLNHNLQHNALHDENLTRNDLKRFCFDLTVADIPEQAATWGLAGEDIEEIRLPSRRFQSFKRALESAEPAAPTAPATSWCTTDSYNENLYYDVPHVFPFVANFLAGSAPGTQVGFWGLNPPMAKAIAKLLEEMGEGRKLLLSRELARLDKGMMEIQGASELVSVADLAEKSDLFLIDFHMGLFETVQSDRGMRSPADKERNRVYGSALSSGVMELAKLDRQRMASGQAPIRQFVFVGFQNTLFEDIVTFEFTLTMGAFASHVHHGTVRKHSKFDPVRGTPPAPEASNPEPSEPKAASSESAIPAWTPAPRDKTLGFNVIGYLTSHTGLGVAARNTMHLLQSKGYPVVGLDIDPGLGRTNQDHTVRHLLADPNQPLPHPVNVFHMNPWEVAVLLRQGHPAIQIAGHMNVTVPFWELSRIPSNWVPVLSSMDLVLAPTRFVQDAIASQVGGTAVRHYPQAVSIPDDIKPNRARWNLPEDAVVFGFSFDFTSVIERKNPIGVIQAFLKVFQGRGDVHLVVKMNHSATLDAYTQAAARFKEMENHHRNIHVIDASLPYRDVLEIMAGWDVYVSLHRAEGLGLGCMECMTMGKAVMATGWSGNMDFMHDANSVLVSHKLIGIDPNSVYNSCLNGEKGHVWAEPDVEEAALWMKRLGEDAELRRNLGKRARYDMARLREEVAKGDSFVQIESFYKQWVYKRAARIGSIDALASGAQATASAGIRAMAERAGRPVPSDIDRPIASSGNAAGNPGIPGPRGAQGLKVLIQNRSSADVAPGGDTVVMEKYRSHLEAAGVRVAVDHDPKTHRAPYDLIHLFNLVLPQTIEPLARLARDAGKPFVVEAFQENQALYLGRSIAFYRLILAYLQQGQKREMLPKLLDLMRMAESTPTDTSAFAANEAAAVITSSREESEYLRSLHPEARTVAIPHGADIEPLDEGPEAFERAFGVKDFVLCVGRLETRKNQLALLTALEDEDMPIVFADGAVCYAPDYSTACRVFRRRGQTVFTGRLSKAMLVSAYRAARLHVLPSWYELPGLVTLEAALYGCPVAATLSGGIREYLGDACTYFEPGDVNGLRQLIRQAYARPRSTEATARAKRYTWASAVGQVIQVYQDVLAGRSVQRSERFSLVTA